MSTLFWTAALCLHVCLLSLTQGKIVEGHLKSSKDWEFLTRFCFLGSVGTSRGHVGRLQWTISYPKDHLFYNKTAELPYRLVVYQEDTWEIVYPGGGLSCEDKVDIVKDIGGYSTLTTEFKYSGCSETDEVSGVQSNAILNCSAGRTFGTPREKWWYIAIAHCGSNKGIDMQYSLHMTNAPEGAIFFQHYSADEFYILQTDIGFLVAYFLMIVLSCYVTYSLVKIQMFHVTYKLYLASIFIQFFSLIIFVAYWSNYGLTGKKQDNWRYFGRFLEFISVILFVILLILVAKGYTITRGRIRKIGVIKIIIFSVIYIAVSISMFIWEATALDPGQVLYIYDSVPGYILIAIQLFAWLWFIYGFAFTIKNYPEKKVFYIPFFIIYCIWFWAGPIMVFIALDYIPKWSREKVVNGVNLFVVFMGHLVFMVLTWPSQANENFPYHVKTTQITDACLGDPNKGIVYDPNNQPVSISYGRPGSESIFTTDTNGTSRPVDIDQFPHETGEYIQERAIAMSRLGES